jgi:hypothetical protein
MTQYTQDELQAEVDRLMKQYDNPAADNRPVLMIDILDQQIARNGGFPKWLYHETLAPQQVKNREQERAIVAQGYKPYYVERSNPYPMYVFRRNMDPKFEQPKPTTGEPGDFIEQRLVRSEQEGELLMKAAKPKTVIGNWTRELSEIAPLPEGPSEDPAVTIARLQGELAAMKTDEAPKRGRPPKAE